MCKVTDIQQTNLETLELIRDEESAAIKPLTSEEIAEIRVLINRSKHRFKTRCIIKSGKKMSFKRMDEAAYFFADGKVAYLVTSKDYRKYMINQTLEELELCLDPKYFFRISRKFIVNIDSIVEVKGLISNRIEVRLQQQPEHDLVVSRSRSKEFRRWLDL